MELKSKAWPSLHGPENRQLREQLGNFCQETSFAVLVNIYRAQNIFKKLLWFLAFLVCLGWLSLMIFYLFQRYFNYPSDVKIELISSPELEFPSVTICNMNPARASALNGPFFGQLRSLNKYNYKEDNRLYEAAQEHYGKRTNIGPRPSSNQKNNGPNDGSIELKPNESAQVLNPLYNNNNIVPTQGPLVSTTPAQAPTQSNPLVTTTFAQGPSLPISTTATTPLQGPTQQNPLRTTPPAQSPAPPNPIATTTPAQGPAPPNPIATTTPAQGPAPTNPIATTTPAQGPAPTNPIATTTPAQGSAPPNPIATTTPAQGPTPTNPIATTTPTGSPTTPVNSTTAFDIPTELTTDFEVFTTDDPFTSDQPQAANNPPPETVSESEDVPEIPTAYPEEQQDVTSGITDHTDYTTYPYTETTEAYFDTWSDFFLQNTFNQWDVLESQNLTNYYTTLDSELDATFRYAVLSAQAPEKDAIETGHSLKNFMISCKFAGYKCSPQNFTTFHNHKYGNCFTFNHPGLMTSVTTKYAGPSYGLTLELYLEQSEYLPALSQEAGVRVVVHSREATPFPEDEGVSVSPGLATSIGLKQVEMKRLPPPHADCAQNGTIEDQYEKNSKYNYSKLSCMKSCYQLLIIKECGCATPLFFVEDKSRVCNMSDTKTAWCALNIEKIKSDEYRSCNTKCPQSCYEKKYDKSLSTAVWPSDVYTQRLYDRVVTSNSDFMQKNYQLGTGEFVKLRVYFQEMVYQRIEDTVSYESQNLVSDIGGQLGLWLGLSAITMGELISFFVLVFRGLSKKIMSNKTTPVEKAKLDPIS